MSTNAQRLKEAVKARREELDLTQLEVWQAGGPSNTTLTKIETGRQITLDRTTARKLDKGLQWVAGSAKAVWNGGGPVPLQTDEGLKEVIAEIMAADISESTRTYILQNLPRRAGDISLSAG